MGEEHQRFPHGAADIGAAGGGPLAAGGRPPPAADNEDDQLENDILDLDVFNQLLLMDDENDSEYGFSREIVQNYLDQAKTIFADMDVALGQKDLSKLSSLGHFLKGSSAAIGVKKVQECCKRIQYLGKLHNITGEGSVDEDEALRLIARELQTGKWEYQRAEEFLGFFYEHESGDEAPQSQAQPQAQSQAQSQAPAAAGAGAGDRRQPRRPEPGGDGRQPRRPEPGARP
ncbi:Phosphorelay intermediate protein [Coemansia javaensis]|uniref:Phosphorelay intermediate protein n=1 Tax=Coemansia javaensis TaxID=2761396 RepID=A0A9W8HF28_9FUNG|nr:Phosphorelay intermediate protein [Coemansia javaensis]